jgi:hypothetical protein
MRVKLAGNEEHFVGFRDDGQRRNQERRVGDDDRREKMP